MKRAKKPRILIGITHFHPTDAFLVSLLVFLEEIKDHYDIEVVEVKDKELVVAQNIIAEKFIESDKEFLLMLECDNDGFTRNMLKALLRGNNEVVAMHYHSRHFPYFSCNMRQIEGKTDEGGPLFAETHTTSGYKECDLVGYGMTLIKRSVFEKLDKPYFRLNEYGGPESYATDIDFCSRLRKAGVVLLGCFDYTLNHRQVNAENVIQLRLEGMKQGREELLKRKGYIV
jgi:hypothetical protein